MFKHIIQILKFVDMRCDVQDIYKATPHGKQVMMFSATLAKEIRPICKKFMQDVITILYISLILLIPYLYYLDS